MKIQFGNKCRTFLITSVYKTQVSNLSKDLLASAKIIAVIMTALGRDSVYSEDRILDNGVDNDTVVAVRRY